MKIETTGHETTAVAVIVTGTFLFATYITRQVLELTHDLMDAKDALDRPNRLRAIDKALG